MQWSHGKQIQETEEISSSFEKDVSGPESGSASSDGEFVSDFQEDAALNGVGEVLRIGKKR